MVHLIHMLRLLMLHFFTHPVFEAVSAIILLQLQLIWILPLKLIFIHPVYATQAR